GLGINGKISELQAAMGLSVFTHMNKILASRKNLCRYYDDNLDYAQITKMKLRENTQWNYSYYPVIFESEEKLLHVQKKLNDHQIFP
ncbi:DegT/DnrJ/EryC1/StrS family aminotransferase, partial [Acinetobacter baumannii]